MVYYLLHLSDHFSVMETVILDQMIRDPNVHQIIYLSEHHTCNWSNHFGDPQVLQLISTGVVRFPLYMREGLAIKLHTLRTAIILNNRENDPQNNLIIRKTDHTKVCQCVCEMFDPTGALYHAITQRHVRSFNIE